MIRNRKILLLFLFNSLIYQLVPSITQAAFDTPPLNPISFGLGNLETFPDFLISDRAAGKRYYLAVSGSRLFAMPELQPFALRVGARGFGAEWSFASQSLSFGPYSETSVMAGYQRKITDQLSTGLEAGFLEVAIKDYGDAWTHQVNLRAGWQVSSNIELSVFWHNVSDARLGEGHYALPRSLSIGGKLNPVKNVNLFMEVQKDFRYSVSTRLGACIEILKYLDVTCGFQSEPNVLAIGFSGLIGPTRAMAAFQYHSELGISQCYGLSVSF
ncbi:MAG: hypothetical protein NTW14_06255 [bacterium]|nr:hypothetical protein [bacterium]